MSTTLLVDDRTVRNGSNNRNESGQEQINEEQINDVPSLPLREVAICSNEVLALLNQGPVALTQDEQPVAVLLAVAEWNKLVDRLELLEDAVEIYKGKLDIALGRDKMIELTPEELAEWAGEAISN